MPHTIPTGQASGASASVTHSDRTPVREGGQALDRYQVLIIAMIAATVLLDGVDTNLLALSIPSLAAEWGRAPSAFANIAALTMFAMMVGSGAAGMISDRIGRRPVLIIATAFYGGGTLAGALAPDIFWMALSRMVTGVGLGSALATAVVAIVEHSPTRMQATATAITITGMPLGSILAGVLGAVIIEPLGWRVLFAIGGIAPLLLAIVYLFWLPESPHSLASRSARTVGGPEAPRGDPRRLLRAPLRRDTLLIWTGFFSCLLASYIVLNWLPALFAGAGATPAVSSASLAYANVGSLAASLSLPLLIYRFGTRPVTVVAALSGAAIATGLAIAFPGSPTHVATFVAISAMMFCAVMLNCLFYAIVTSVYGADVRGVGMGFGLAVGRIGAVASAYLGAWALSGGGQALFGTVAIALLVAFVCFGMISKHAPPGRRKA